MTLHRGQRPASTVLAAASPVISGNLGQQVATEVPAADSCRRMSDHRKQNRKALTVRLSVEVIERLKKIAREAAGRPCFASVGGIVEAGIIAECNRIEAILDASIISPTEPALRPTLPERCVQVTTVNNCGPLRR